MDTKHDELSRAHERARQFDELRWHDLVNQLCWYKDNRHLGIVTEAAILRRQELDDVWDWSAGLEPSELAPPWTPALLLLLCRIGWVIDHYKYWHEHGNPEHPLHSTWWPDIPQTPELTTGEQVFDLILEAFREAGLDQDTQRRTLESWHNSAVTDTEPWNWVVYIESMRDCYRKRTRWLGPEIPWTSFQVDINSPSLFLDVTGPDVWQVIIDAVRGEAQHSYRVEEFLGNMRMASLDYIQKEIPGPHSDPDRKHLKDNPFGYGTSVTMPSFGYRREHRSEQRLAGWAAAHKMDLFNEELW